MHLHLQQRQLLRLCRRDEHLQFLELEQLLRLRLPALRLPALRLQFLLGRRNEHGLVRLLGQFLLVPALRLRQLLHDVTTGASGRLT